MQFPGLAIQLEQALSVHIVRNDRLFVVRRLRLFVGHLEEEEERDLLGIGHVRQAIVPQDVGEVPGFVDDLLAVVGHGFSEFNPKHNVRRNQSHDDSTICETRSEMSVSNGVFPDRRYIV